MKTKNIYFALTGFAFAAVASFVFYQKFYLYHLAYREQTQLFLLSGEYINTYFHRSAWLACLAGDFLTQFYCFNYIGALIITLSLLSLGGLFYLALGKVKFNFLCQNKQCKGLPFWIKILLVLALMTWEAFRNFGLDYELASTLSLIGGLSLFLLCTSFPQKGHWIFPILLTPLCYWLFGYGVFMFLILCLIFEINSHRYFLALLLIFISILTPALLRQQYHFTCKQAYQYPSNSFFNKPNFIIEDLLKLDVLSSYGSWAKVAELTEKKDLQLAASTYFYNLSHAMQGRLPIKLMDAYQPGTLGLLITLEPKTPFLSIWSSNEAWFQLGDMTMAEHATILGMIFSPKRRSSRMTKRLAEINMINGDTLASMKYLRLLQKTIVYKGWANERIPGHETDRVKKWLLQKQSLLSTQDTLRSAGNHTLSLRALVNNHPENNLALDYLLCHDLLAKDIDSFMADYLKYKGVGKEMPNRLYSEALLIGLTNRHASIEDVKQHLIQADVVNDFNAYNLQYEKDKGSGNNLQASYGKTYWFYYHFATFN